jgi:hypothetical protein
LQAILMQERATVERFWIIAAPENRASSAGISKAGFSSIAHLSFQRHGQPGLAPMNNPMNNGDRLSAASALLHISVVHADPHLALAPCWHCANDARQDGRDVGETACWPVPSRVERQAIPCHCA